MLRSESCASNGKSPTLFQHHLRVLTLTPLTKLQTPDINARIKQIKWSDMMLGITSYVKERGFMMYLFILLYLCTDVYQATKATSQSTTEVGDIRNGR